MAKLYSLQIFTHAGLLSGAGKVGPVVPAGLVYVLRDVDVFELSGSGTAGMVIYNAAGGFLRFFSGPVDTVTRSYAWRGRQVYNAGEQVGFQTQVGEWAIMASGYQLTNP